MPNSHDFIDHVLELARGAGKPTARARFGGHGIYLDGQIVAIAIDARDLPPFVYVTKDGERIVMSYRLAPDEALETPAAMREWLRLALGAALRKPQKVRRRG